MVANTSWQRNKSKFHDPITEATTKTSLNLPQNHFCICYLSMKNSMILVKPKTPANCMSDEIVNSTHPLTPPEKTMLHEMKRNL